MFFESKCDFCGECLEQCKYIDFDREQGAHEFERLVRGENVDWLHKCITCFACNEYCTKGAEPFDLIIEKIEASGDYVPPKVVAAFKNKFAPSDDFKIPAVQKPVMSICTIEPLMPSGVEGPMFEGMSIVRGRHFFCNVMFPHLGKASIMHDTVQSVVDRYASLNVDEIIFLHDDCYSLMTSVAPKQGIELPFRPVHIFEYLVNYLKEHKNSITPLNMKIAYQRPCASRLTPWKDPMLDEIFELIGVERVARKYDGLDSLCCGQNMKGIVGRGEKYPEYQNVNVMDAQENGAEAMVFLCPMCLDALDSNSGKRA